MALKKYLLLARLSNAAPLLRDLFAAIIALLLGLLPALILTFVGDALVRYGLSPAVPLALRALEYIFLLTGFLIILISAARIVWATWSGTERSDSSVVSFLGNTIQRLWDLPSDNLRRPREATHVVIVPDTGTLSLSETGTVSVSVSVSERISVSDTGTVSVQHLIPILENGSFEYGTAGWGTGFFESNFASPAGAPLMFNGATATWSIDSEHVRSGHYALGIDHRSTNSPHVFSTFSQRVKVLPSTGYEVRFWAYLEFTDGRGAFSLRALPSRRTTPGEWDRFKQKVDPRIVDEWQEVRCNFDSGSDTFFDLRFIAETAMRLWVDDVTLLPVPK